MDDESGKVSTTLKSVGLGLLLNSPLISSIERTLLPTLGFKKFSDYQLESK